MAMCAGLVQPAFAQSEPASPPDLEISFGEPVSKSELTRLDGRAEEANRWQQLSLPIGNSMMGANIYGEVDKERLTFNEKTIWNGGPSDSRPDYNGGNKTTVNGVSMADYVKSVREAFLNGDANASNMCNQIVGISNGYGSYQNLGDIYIDFDRVSEDDVNNGIETIDDRDARIIYSSGWSDYPQGSDWYQGTEKYSYTDQASFTFTFNGTGVRMMGVKYNEMGNCDVYLDDMTTPVISNQSMHSASKIANTPLFELSDLTPGEHTVKFVNKANGNLKKCSFDRLEVTLESGQTIVDLNPSNAAETNVQYSSDWGMWDRAANGEADADEWVNKDEMFCQNPNASTKIEYTFTGDAIALYGGKHSPLGTLTWSIDGGAQSGDVNCYAPAMKRQELFMAKNLGEGEHTVTITSKDNTKLSFDNFVVYDTTPADDAADETHTEATNYTRSLSLDDSLARVEYDRDNTHYTREYLMSNPDNVMAIRLEAEGEKTLDFDVSFPISMEGTNALGKTAVTTASADGSLDVVGSMNDNQMKFAGSIQVVTDQGTVTPNEDSLSIEGASEAVIYVSAGTDYENTYPVYRSGETSEEVAARVSQTVDQAAAKGYEQVREDHLADYHGIYDRMSIDLGQTKPNLHTPDLLKAYNSKSLSESERRYMEVLLFQYGRYLQISSTRENDKLPANLQGVWSIYTGDHNAVPWGSDYHMNVNMQMNYWPTYSTNMEECGLPMIDYIDSLREPGRVTASTYFGVDNSNGQHNGYSAHTQNTPFGWTCPGWAFSWGWSPAAVPWMLQNVYEYYEYTQDTEFLRDKIFPMMEEEAKLYEQILTPVTYNNGVTRLVTVPAYSPEHGPYTAGNVYENVLAWQLFNDCLEAAEVLNAEVPGSVSQERMDLWKSILDQLKPIEIGASGQIKEWYDETTLGSVSGAQSNHRHLSHLLGLFPGDLISADTPEYLEAAKVSLNARGDESTGWAMAQRINSWARLKDGDRCLSLINTLFKNGIFPNLWDAHPPFQIDGNFGYTSGVAEMLMQSNASSIELLPALPAAWSEGSVHGIKARGNFVIDFEWNEGQVSKASITSNAGGTCVLNAEGLANVQIVDARGNKVASSEEDGNIVFETQEGMSYVLDADNQKQPEDPETADKTLLNMAVNYADAAVQNGALEGVNALVVNEFNAALEEAKGLLTSLSATQEQVDASWIRLTRAIHMLDFKSDKTALDALIAECEAINPDAYDVEQSVRDEFREALAFAKQVSEDPAALTEESIAQAIARLEAAKAALGQIGTLDTSLLAMIIGFVKDANMDEFTPVTAAPFAESLAKAQAVLANPESQQQVDEAANELHQAWLNLRRKPDEALLEQIRGFVAEAQDFALYGDAGLIALRDSLVEEANNLLADPNATQKQAEDLAGRIEAFRQDAAALQAPAAEQKKPSSQNSVKTSTETNANVWIWGAVAALVVIAGLGFYLFKNKKSDSKK